MGSEAIAHEAEGYESERNNKLLFKPNIRQKQNLNLICFVSVKNQNWEMYFLLTVFYDA